MTAPQGAVPARSAHRMQIVELRMGLLTKPGGIIFAPGTPFTMPSACALRSLRFSLGDCDHYLTCQKVETDDAQAGLERIGSLKTYAPVFRERPPGLLIQACFPINISWHNRSRRLRSLLQLVEAPLGPSI
jgi:hypothetical protein